MNEEMKIEMAESEFKSALGDGITPEQMEQVRGLINRASREYVKREIRKVEHRKTKSKARAKNKVQKASRKQNRK